MMEIEVTDVLIAKSVLRTKEPEIQRIFSESGQSVAVDCNDPDYGAAFLYQWLFSDAVNLEKAGFSKLQSNVVFYNKYYWLKKFIKAHMAKHGFDAGLEQMEFKLLENPNCDPDWSVVETLSKLAEKDEPEA